MTKIVKLSDIGTQDRTPFFEGEQRSSADIILFPGVFYCRRDGARHAPLSRARDWIELVPRS